MLQDLYSAEQVAERLGLHVRTVRGYVRDGRLKAVRIGKQYRIAREDLEAFAGRGATAGEREPIRRQRYAEASSVVQIEALSPDAAIRMTTGLAGAINSRRGEGGSARLDSIYDETRAVLKIIVTGPIQTTLGLLQLVQLYLEQPE